MVMNASYDDENFKSKILHAKINKWCLKIFTCEIDLYSHKVKSSFFYYTVCVTNSYQWIYNDWFLWFKKLHIKTNKRSLTIFTICETNYTDMKEKGFNRNV